MKVPFFNLDRQYQVIGAEAEERVIEVMRSGQYIEGPAVKELEEKMSAYLGVKHVITCGNGTDSIRLALQACGVKPGDEVITTSFSFFATAEAIGEIGAIPVFADIDAKSFNIDAEDVKRKITKATKAILIVHIFGMPADMDELNEIGRVHNIPVIEDACQAIGAEYKGKKAGALGTMGCFSFYPTKNLGGFGDGGMVTTNDDKLAEICRALKSHAAGKLGARAYRNLFHKEVPELTQLESMSGDALYDPCKYYNYFIGENSRLDSMQAAVLLVKLKYLDEFNKKRFAIAKKYSESLNGTPLIVPETAHTDRISCWHQYAVLAEGKADFSRYLGEHGIGTGSFYPVPLHLQKAFQSLNYQPGSMPVAESICEKSVCLPIFPELEMEEVEYIIDVIKRYYQ